MDGISIQQFHGRRESVALALDHLHGDTAFTQRVNVFPHSHATDAKCVSKLLAGVKPAIGKDIEYLPPRVHGVSLSHHSPGIPRRPVRGKGTTSGHQNIP